MGTTWLITKSELHKSFRSVRFALVVLIIVPLFLGATALGVNKYLFLEKAYQATLHQQSESFGAIKTFNPLMVIRVAAYRPVNPASLLGTGVSSLMGDTYLQYNCQNPPAVQTELIHNSFQRLHGGWDLLTIVVLVISFLAILLSYDAIAGEKRDGTIKLFCASSARRTSIALGKILGLTITLAIPLVLGTVLSGILISIMIPDRIMAVLPELGGLTAMAILYSAVFISLGVTVSAMFHRPFRALILLLALWILLVIAVPQLITFVAATAHPTPSEEESDKRKSASTDEFIKFHEILQEIEDDIERRGAWFDGTKDYQKNLQRIWTDTSNSLKNQEEVTWMWGWTSPASGMLLPMTTLFGTNPAAEVRTMEDVWDSQQRYIEFLKTRIVADMEEARRAGRNPNELRVYAGGIPWHEFPKTEFQTPAAGARWSAFAFGILIQLGWLASLLLCTIVLIRRYDPR